MISDLRSERTGQTHAPRYKQYQTPRLKNRFFGPAQMLSLASAVVVALILLFPRVLISKQLASGLPPQAATLAYLKLQLRAKPQDQAIRQHLARAQLKVGQLADAAVSLEPLISSPTPATAHLWLQLQRARYVATQPDSQARAHARVSYRDALRHLAPLLDTTDLLAEIHDATGAGMYETSAQLAIQLLDHERTDAHTATSTARRQQTAAEVSDTPSLYALAGGAWRVSPSATAPSPESPPTIIDPTNSPDRHEVRREAFEALLESRLASGHPAAAAEDIQHYVGLLAPQDVDWARLIRIARWADKPAIGTSLAQQWLRYARDPEIRWQAFNALIDAHLAAGQPRAALAAAQANLGRIRPSRRLWRLMTHLSMQAGDADQAARYASQMVQLDSANAH